MKKITIFTIPHKQQRYDTVGDYFLSKRTSHWIFNISKMNNDDYEFLVAIHELIEWRLTQKRGITEESISSFDKKFELKRKKGNNDEPGNDIDAPYYKEHVFAESIEKQIAKELGVDWDKYDKEVTNL